MEATRARVKVICEPCKGTGLIIGPARVFDGVTIHPERNCERCNGAGHSFATIEIEASELTKLLNAALKRYMQLNATALRTWSSSLTDDK